MIQKIPVKRILLVCVGAATVACSILLTRCEPRQRSEDFPNLSKASQLIELADSVRNSKPDTALRDYKLAISLLQKHKSGVAQANLLGKSYVGIAYLFSESGEYKLALENDSIALTISSQYNDNQIKAKALVMRGITLFRLGSYDKALDCYEKAMTSAVEIKDFEIQAKIYANRAMISFYQGENQKTIEGFTRALNIGKQIKSKLLIAGNYMNLAVVYNNLSQNDSVLTYYQLALKLVGETNDKGSQLLCYQNLGNLYYDFANFDKAIDYYTLSVQLAIEMNDKSNTAKGYHNLSEVFAHIGDNAKATDFLFKSIKIKEQLNDKLSLAKGYIAVGEMYYNRMDYPKARTYFEKSLYICRELKNLNEVGSNLSNIANILGAQSKSDSAIVFFNQALVFFRKTDNMAGISNLHINMGSEYSLKKNYLLAEKFLSLALKEKTKLSDEEGYAIVCHHLANLYLLKANGVDEKSKYHLLKMAEELGKDSYATAKRIGTIPVRRDASGILKRIYQKQGNYSEALNYSEIYNTLSDSLLNKDKIQALTFAEARWNIEKKQKEIDNLGDAQKLQQEIIEQNKLEARQHRIIIWLIVAFSLLGAISTLITHLYLRNRREAAYQKQLTNMTALKMQNTRNTMSPHFFLNLLATLTGLFGQPEELKEKLNSLALLLRRMFENIDKVAIPLEDELKAVKAYIDLYTNQIPETFDVEYIIAEGTKLDGLIPAMMLQIPVENAIKHGLMPLDGHKILKISIGENDGHQQIG